MCHVSCYHSLGYRMTCLHSATSVSLLSGKSDSPAQSRATICVQLCTQYSPVMKPLHRFLSPPVPDDVQLFHHLLTAISSPPPNVLTATRSAVGLFSPSSSSIHCLVVSRDHHLPHFFICDVHLLLSSHFSAIILLIPHTAPATVAICMHHHIVEKPSDLLPTGCVANWYTGIPLIRRASGDVARGKGLSSTAFASSHPSPPPIVDCWLVLQ